MANNKNEKTKVENVSRETSVHGTNNNVGQEVSKMQPSTDVISCTMTDEEHKARIERIHAKMEAGLKLSWDILVDITSAKERKEQTLDGYSETEADFNKWAMELFGMGETQIKQASRLIGFYGSIDDKGEYTLEDKYKRYTKEKLDIIQRLPQLKTRAQFDEVVESLGIMPNTSEGVLKEIVREAKGLPQKDDTKKDDTKKEKKPEKISVTDVSAIKQTEAYKQVDSKRDMLLQFTASMREEAKKVIESKDNKLAMAFTIRFMDAFNELEQNYNNVGKEEKETK